MTQLNTMFKIGLSSLIAQVPCFISDLLYSMRIRPLYSSNASVDRKFVVAETRLTCSLQALLSICGATYIVDQASEVKKAKYITS